MTLSRADNKQMELVREEVEIDEFLENISKTYGEIIELQEKKLILDLNYKRVISIDTNKIYQVIVILLDNAMKYTSSGNEIRISSYLKDGKCVIEVVDSGIGISPDNLTHIFQKFLTHK